MRSRIAGPTTRGSTSRSGSRSAPERLSIIDPEGGHQPIANEDGTVVVACNGEIYNFRALRERLLRSGHVLRTNVDTEVIVHLYEELGDDFVHELDGMFGFAIWDERRQSCCSSATGSGSSRSTTPATETGWSSARRSSSLLRHPDVNARPDLDALAAFLLLKYVPAPRTMFAGIEALPPGHLLVSDDAASGRGSGGTCRSSARPITETSARRPTSSAPTCATRCAATSSATCRSAPSSAAASTPARSSR